MRQAILRRLPEATCTSAAVAADLGVSRRTLNRRLVGAGLSFGGVLAQVRLDLARQYLAGGRLSMTQIAGLLGFSALASFSRWHARQTRMAPSHWRRAAAAPGPQPAKS